MAELTATPYRVVAPMVGCRAPNSLGLPGARGGLVAVQVDQGSMLPLGAPPEDVARLVFKGMVEPVDGDIDDQVAAELERIKAAHYRPPAPPLTPAQRLSFALTYLPAQAGDAIAAIEALVDERVAAALVQTATAAEPQFWRSARAGASSRRCWSSASGRSWAPS